MDRYKDFVITSVCLADLESQGYDCSKLDEGDMRHLADKMADAYLDSVFWQDLDIIAQDVLHLTKKKID